jgi:hypothetical protein
MNTIILSITILICVIVSYISIDTIYKTKKNKNKKI